MRWGSRARSRRRLAKQAIAARVHRTHDRTSDPRDTDRIERKEQMDEQKVIAERVGERVFAVQAATENTITLIGFGVYVGDEEPPGFLIPNPKIMLDDGRTVWGIQCWWGPESRYASFKGERVEVIATDFVELRS